jgi:hypothetical protein
MPKALAKPEVAARMVEWRNLQALHARAIAKVAKLEALLRQKDGQLAAKDAHIAELGHAPLDKEAQRKALSTKLWKAREGRPAEKAGQTGANKPGAQTGHEARRRPIPADADATGRVVFGLAKCPACKHQVGDAVDKVEKYQEDIGIAPRQKVVRHYAITWHWCPNCQEYVRPIDTPAQNLRRFGPNAMGYVLYARYRLRLPLLKTQGPLRDLHGFGTSGGGVVTQLDDARDMFGNQYGLICELIRSAKAVYADEPGWRMDGDNWYIWAFADKASGAIRYELAETRGGAIAKGALGGTAAQVIVSGGYSTYNSTGSPDQQRWIHLIRVAKEKAGQAKPVKSPKLSSPCL